MKSLGQVVEDAVYGNHLKTRMGKVVSMSHGPPRTITAIVGGATVPDIVLMDGVLTCVGGDVWILDMGGGRWMAFGSSNSTPDRRHMNYIRNGAFNIWQRGGGAFAGNVYNADGFYTFTAGTTASMTRQSFTLGNTIPGQESPFYHRTVVTSVAGANNLAVLWQAIEGVRSLAGQTATLSFWAKADAAKNIAVEFDQYFGSGGGASGVVTNIGSQKIMLSTAWKRYSVTVSIPSITGKTIGTDGKDRLGVNLWMDAGSTFNARSATLGQQSGTFEFWGLQLEHGSATTDFERLSPEEDLRQNQRYLYARTSTGASECLGHGGWATSATIGNVGVALPVTMRATPTVSYTGNWGLSDGVTYVAATGITVLTGQSQPSHVVLQVTVAAGLATFRPHRLETGSVSATFAFTAELG